MRHSTLPVIALSLTACGGAEQPKPAEASPSAKASESAPPATPAADAKTDEAPIADAPATDAPATAPPTQPVAPPSIPVAPPGEVAINPWFSSPHTATWQLAAEPTEALTFAGELQAGVLARAGTTWLQLGEGGQLVAAVMDIEPKADIQGVWPSGRPTHGGSMSGGSRTQRWSTKSCAS